MSLFLCATGIAASTHATCTLPVLELVWSAPADGETDVPLDANMQLITSTPRQGSWSAVLNDREIGTGNGDSFELGALTPDTHYTFRLLPVGGATRAPRTPIEINFHTGSGMTSRVDAPTVSSTSVTPNAPPATSDCDAVLRYNRCFDTPQLVFRTFDVSDSSAVAYQLEAGDGPPKLWPAGCEITAPEQPQDTGNGGQTCYQISAVDARGIRSPATEHCIGYASRDSAPASPSCSPSSIPASRTSGWLMAPFAAIAALLTRTRRRRLGVQASEATAEVNAVGCERAPRRAGARAYRAQRS